MQWRSLFKLYWMFHQKILLFFSRLGKFYQISLGEAFYILVSFLIMIAINYLLIAINGFSLSYAKQWPNITCVGSVLWLLLFLLSLHFVCRRCKWVLWVITTLQFFVFFVLFLCYLYYDWNFFLWVYTIFSIRYDMERN